MSEEEREVSADTQDSSMTADKVMSVDNWRDTIPEDIRGHKIIKETPDITTMAKRLVDANNFISKSIRLPDDGDTSGMDDLYNKLGRPETPEGYKIDRPQLQEGQQYNEETEKSFLDAAHKIGLNSSQVNALMKWNQEQVSGMQAQAIESNEEAAAGLRREWGNAYKERIATVNDVLNQFADEDVRESVQGNPVLVKLLYDIGKNLVEGKAEGEGRISHTRTPEDAMKKIMELKRDPSFQKAYYDKRDATHDDAVAQMQKLMEEAHPEPEATVL